MSIKITDVKLVGFCTKHRNESTEIPKFKDGGIVPDNDICCIACSLFKEKTK